MRATSTNPQRKPDNVYLDRGEYRLEANMGEFRLKLNMHQMKHWSDYLESDSDNESDEEDTKETEKLTSKTAKKEKKEKKQSNPYSFKHWRDLLETDSDKEEDEQTCTDSKENDDDEEDGEALFNILDFGNLKGEDTDNDDSETSARMMKPPFNKVKKPKEKYMNRIAVKTDETDEIVYQPKDNTWREDIDLGIYDIGMTTIISPKYNFNDDMKQHHGNNDKEQQEDKELHLSDNGYDNNDVKERNKEWITYNESRVGQLEADLDEARSDLKSIVSYLMETDEKFSRHHDGISVSHESISTFIDAVHQKDNTMENEIESEKSDEWNRSIDDNNGDFILVTNKRRKRNNNRKKNKNNRKKSLLGTTVINVLGIGNGNITSEDSTSVTGGEECSNVTPKSSDTETKEQDFQKAKA